MDSFTSAGMKFPLLEFGPGDGEAVVLLHGFPADTQSWKPTARILAAAGYRVLVPFQRGYVATARPKQVAAYRLRELSADVLSLLDAAGVERAHIVGHDWGGGVAWYLADRHSQRVATLTAVATPHPRALARTLLTSKQLLLSWYLLFFQIPRLPEWLLTRNKAQLGSRWLRKLGLEDRTATEYAQAFAADRALMTGALNWYRALLLDAPYGWAAKPVTPATLYVWGTADGTVSAKAARLTAKGVTGAYTFHRLEEATHWIPEQHPQELAELILQHMRTHK
ncbi:alpha/beta fold hydrolase [Streptomyces sp. NPDC056401]|uniref:alpha/beta fold hydrolase n=1 Tax=Streptomyces sp. NPDC056401 TaxID=3345809 RepID=UPI0035D6D2F7